MKAYFFRLPLFFFGRAPPHSERLEEAKCQRNQVHYNLSRMIWKADKWTKIQMKQRVTYQEDSEELHNLRSSIPSKLGRVQSTNLDTTTHILSIYQISCWISLLSKRLSRGEGLRKEVCAWLRSPCWIYYSEKIISSPYCALSKVYLRLLFCLM